MDCRKIIRILSLHFTLGVFRSDFSENGTPQTKDKMAALSVAIQNEMLSLGH